MPKWQRPPLSSRGKRGLLRYYSFVVNAPNNLLRLQIPTHPPCYVYVLSFWWQTNEPSIRADAGSVGRSPPPDGPSPTCLKGP